MRAVAPLRLALASATIAAAFVLGACERTSPPRTTTTPVPVTPSIAAAAPAPLDDARLIAGELPDGTPAAALLRTRCGVCHTADYVTQQRLTAAQWDKTLAKMEKWGATLSAEERGQFAALLSTTWRADLPERAPMVVPPPAGAVGQAP